MNLDVAQRSHKPYLIRSAAEMVFISFSARSVPQIGAKLRDSFWPTFVTGCAFWPTVNIFNFRFLGPAHRVAYVNAMGLLWNSYLSYANSGGAASNAAAGASLPRKAMALAAATPDARR